MGARSYSTEEATDTTLVTTTEAVICTLPGVSTDRPGQTVRLTGMAKITNGTGTTALNLRIRRDSLTGTEVSESNVVQIETAAASTEDHGINADDPISGEVAGQVYVLTAQQTGASANGTSVYAYLRADIG